MALLDAYGRPVQTTKLTTLQAEPGMVGVRQVWAETVASGLTPRRLAQILREESVDVLLTYDRNGGYGHRDHVQVHHVGARAAELAGTPRVLQATVPRDAICRALDLAALVYPFPAEFDRASFDRAYSARAEITHHIDVHRHIAAKRASMRAHASQGADSGGGDRTLGMLVRIPRPLYDLAFGREWFVDPLAPAGTARTDVFEGLG